LNSRVSFLAMPVSFSGLGVSSGGAQALACGQGGHEFFYLLHMMRQRV